MKPEEKCQPSLGCDTSRCVPSEPWTIINLFSVKATYYRLITWWNYLVLDTLCRCLWLTLSHTQILLVSSSARVVTLLVVHLVHPPTQKRSTNFKKISHATPTRNIPKTYFSQKFSSYRCTQSSHTENFHSLCHRSACAPSTVHRISLMCTKKGN